MRESFSCVCVGKDKLYCFGGIGFGARVNDTFIYDVGGASWRAAATKGSRPCARSHHTATVIAGNMYVFGGEADAPRGGGGGGADGSVVGRKLLGDMHRLDTTTLRWHAVPYSKDCFLPGFRKYGCCAKRGPVVCSWRTRGRGVGSAGGAVNNGVCCVFPLLGE